MENVVLTIHLLLALLLIGVVLLQRSEGGGLLGGGGVMTNRGATNALQKVTWALAAAFIVTSITLTILSAQATRGISVLDNAAETPATDADAPALPAIDLAPATGDAPVAPPPAQ